jgi:hypothetical protein
VRVHEAPPPSKDDVAEVARRVRDRALGWLRRHGYLDERAAVARARDAEATGPGGEAEDVHGCVFLACARVARGRVHGAAVRFAAIAPAGAAAGGQRLAGGALSRALGTPDGRRALAENSPTVFAPRTTSAPAATLTSTPRSSSSMSFAIIRSLRTKPSGTTASRRRMTRSTPRVASAREERERLRTGLAPEGGSE